MKDEYIIISKTAIQKRIEELEKKSKEFYCREGIDEYDFAKEELEQILSKSTPLIPVVEKSISFCWFETKKELPHLINIQSDYISKLKLDI